VIVGRFCETPIGIGYKTIATLPSLERNFQLQIFFKERPKVSLFSASILFLAASESGLLAVATVRRLSAEITFDTQKFLFSIRGKPGDLTTKSD